MYATLCDTRGGVGWDVRRDIAICVGICYNRHAMVWVTEKDNHTNIEV